MRYQNTAFYNFQIRANMFLSCHDYSVAHLPNMNIQLTRTSEFVLKIIVLIAEPLNQTIAQALDKKDAPVARSIVFLSKFAS